VLVCWSDDGGVKEGEETEEGGGSEAEQPSPFLPPNQHSNTPTPPCGGNGVRRPPGLGWYPAGDKLPQPTAKVWIKEVQPPQLGPPGDGVFDLLEQ
jgi:hypothetical protein